ncbi:hypothetical protein EJV47_24285 [Hymenobacter gummosus]|uniref:TonB C-terminal domain-containing protein n=1 Tax=Hymenobacter gummosus TaxID=1776032 RepID=A0A3S0IJF9_9BACT|nr:energy transducer TonB [Hymenobacter gummosus]RTQ45613.1 hypothetical protein EJV47_24285 [Hymenobacter gummosus]
MRLPFTLCLLGGLVAGPLAAQQVPNLPVVAVLDELRDKPTALRYYDQWWAPLPSAEGAACYDVLQRQDSAGVNWHVRRYDIATKRPLLDLGFSGPLPWAVPEGRSRQWYPSGQLREEASYRKGMAEGRLRTLYPDGKPRRIVDYYRQRVAKAECFDAAGEAVECPAYHTFAQLPADGASPDVVERIAQTYPQHLPAGFSRAGKGAVYFAFYVDTLGRAQAPRILRSDDEGLSAAVLEAIRRLPTFEPARQEGRLTHDAVEGFVLYSPAVAKRRK